MKLVASDDTAAGALCRRHDFTSTARPSSILRAPRWWSASSLASMHSRATGPPRSPGSRRPSASCWNAFRSGKVERAQWERLIALYADPTRPRRGSILGLQVMAETAGLHGEPDLALASLEAAADTGLSDVVWIDRCPLLDGLDPVRFTPIRVQVAARAARVLARFRTASAAR